MEYTRHTHKEGTAIVFVLSAKMFACRWMQIAISAISVSPASCEVRAVRRFLVKKGSLVAEIITELCQVYGSTVMNEEKLKQR